MEAQRITESRDEGFSCFLSLPLLLSLCRILSCLSCLLALMLHSVWVAERVKEFPYFPFSSLHVLSCFFCILAFLCLLCFPSCFSYPLLVRVIMRLLMHHSVWGAVLVKRDASNSMQSIWSEIQASQLLLMWRHSQLTGRQIHARRQDKNTIGHETLYDVTARTQQSKTQRSWLALSTAKNKKMDGFEQSSSLYIINQATLSGVLSFLLNDPTRSHWHLEGNC